MVRSAGIFLVVALLLTTATQAQQPDSRRSEPAGRGRAIPGPYGNPTFGHPRGYPYGQPGGLQGLIPGLVLGLGLSTFMQPAPAVRVAPGGYPQAGSRSDGEVRVGLPPGYPPQGTQAPH
jgi:hypothetical protein